jgi:DNA-binding MarR family transcriptional regulator
MSTTELAPDTDRPTNATDAAETLAAVTETAEHALTDDELAQLDAVYAFLRDRARDVDFDAVGYLLSSHFRVDVLRTLADAPATPAMVAEHFDGDIAHYSRAIKQLADRDLVELLVDEERKKGRIYGVTGRGERALAQLDEMNTEADA